MNFKETGLKFKLLVSLKNLKDLSLVINVDIVINLGTGKTAALNIEEGLREEIDQALNQVLLQVVTDESNIIINLGKKEEAEEDHLPHQAHRQILAPVHHPRGNYLNNLVVIKRKE